VVVAAAVARQAGRETEVGAEDVDEDGAACTKVVRGEYFKKNFRAYKKIRAYRKKSSLQKKIEPTEKN
jgi:hypothetical protein